METLLRDDTFFLVPARSGSKGLLNKNLRKIEGVSLVERAVICAKRCSSKASILVSTDSQKILEKCRPYKIENFGLRPPALSDDESNIFDVWRYEWRLLERAKNKNFKFSILLEPSSPNRIPHDVISCVNRIMEKKSDFCFSVSEIPQHLNPMKAIEFDTRTSRAQFAFENSEENVNRQALKTYYHRNGLCYVITKEALMSKKKFRDLNIDVIRTQRKVANVDCYEDLLFARKVQKISKG